MLALSVQTLKDELGSLILLPDLEFHLWKWAVFQQKYWEYQNEKAARDRQAIEVTED